MSDDSLQKLSTAELINRLMSDITCFEPQSLTEIRRRLEAAEQHECAAKRALRLAFKLPRPWMDKGISYRDWDAAINEIETALATTCTPDPSLEHAVFDLRNHLHAIRMMSDLQLIHEAAERVLDRTPKIDRPPLAPNDPVRVLVTENAAPGDTWNRWDDRIEQLIPEKDARSLHAIMKQLVNEVLANPREEDK